MLQLQHFEKIAVEGIVIFVLRTAQVTFFEKLNSIKFHASYTVRLTLILL